MTTPELIGWGLLMAAGLAGSALCSGLETGFYTLSRIRLNVRAGAERPERAASVLKREVDRPERLLTTLLIGNNAFNYIGTLGLTAILVGAGLSDIAVIVLQALVLTPLLLIFAESIPKEHFRVEADRLTYRFAGFLRGLRLLLTAAGVLPGVVWFAQTVSRVVGAGSSTVVDPRERMAALLKEAAGAGVISDVQSSLVDRALAFSRATVAEEMIPWAGVRTVGAEWDRDRVLRWFVRHNCSRFPVLDRRGRVVGVLRQIDVHLNPEQELRALWTAPFRMDPGLTAREALVLLRDSGSAMAVVERDGHPVGIITAKDLFEPLTGELAAW